MTRAWLLLLMLLGLAPAVRADAGWVPVPGAMSDQRWAPAVALLPGGAVVLIAGGFSYALGRCVPSADRFDEAGGRFVPCKGRLSVGRNFAPAVPLADGRVLVAGGYNTRLGSLDTAELYDPKTDSFRLLPARLTEARELFAATLLRDGRVLLTGGLSLRRRGTQASAELFDPHTESFTRLPAAMADDRFGQAAVRLADGRVLIVGGKHWTVGRPDRPLASAEIFDPATGRFHTTAGAMAVPRDRPTATLLADGTVLVAGGQNGADGPQTVELFDPRSEMFLPLIAALAVSRMAHADGVLPDGRVVLCGGWCPPDHATTATVAVYDPQTRLFGDGPEMPWDAHDLAVIVLGDGLVLAAGGKQVRAGREASLAGGAVWRPSPNFYWKTP